MRALLIAVVAGAGCAGAPLDADREYARADSRIRAVEEFRMLDAECRAKGGVILVDRVGRLGPSAFDLRTARCTAASPTTRGRR